VPIAACRLSSSLRAAAGSAGAAATFSGFGGPSLYPVVRQLVHAPSLTRHLALTRRQATAANRHECCPDSRRRVLDANAAPLTCRRGRTCRAGLLTRFRQARATVLATIETAPSVLESGPRDRHRAAPDPQQLADVPAQIRKIFTPLRYSYRIFLVFAITFLRTARAKWTRRGLGQSRQRTETSILASVHFSR